LGWPEKSVSNALDVLPGWRGKASCTMMGLSQTTRFQPEVPGRMGSTELLCLRSAEGYRHIVSMRAALQNPIVLLLSQEVLLNCSS